jgi:hypothetical protein
MTEKQLMQDDFIKILQKNKIDFIRTRNSGFQKKVKAPHTHAFEKAFPCDKYLPDVMYCHQGKVFMVEFGIKENDRGRKERQEERMSHWSKNGGTVYVMCYSWEDCEQILIASGVINEE